MTESIGVKATKPLATIYAALLLSVVALLLMSYMFAGDIADYRVRIISLVFFACALILIIGAEIGRFLFKAGITPIGFIGFLVTNLLFILFLFASMVDHMGSDISETTGAMLGTLLILGLAWYAIIIIWSIVVWGRDWRKNRETKE
jgi:hypothetical protein